MISLNMHVTKTKASGKNIPTIDSGINFKLDVHVLHIIRSATSRWTGAQASPLSNLLNFVTKVTLNE